MLNAQLTRDPGGDASRVGLEVVQVGVVAAATGVGGRAADDQQLDVVTI